MKWISVKEQLPETDGRYLIFSPTADEAKPLITIAWYEPIGSEHLNGWQLIPECFCESLTHWMPLPEPPE